MRIKERKSYNTGNYICRNPKAEIYREEECRRIMAHYDTFHTECLEAALQKKNNTYAYVSYLQGYPGIGKSFLCEKMYRIFQNEHAKECITIFYNLQNREQTDFALYLFDLANAFSQYVENASVFPRFSATFSQYQKLCGQKAEAIEVETKAEAFSRNEYVSLQLNLQPFAFPFTTSTRGRNINSASKSFVNSTAQTRLSILKFSYPSILRIVCSCKSMARKDSFSSETPNSIAFR